MENQNIVYVKKESGFWKFVKIALAVAAICFVAAKIYQKFFKKKTVEAIEEADAPEALPEAEENVEVAEAEEFEVPAEAVIANAEDMEVNAEA
jgi:hypothetical protein